PVLSLNGCMSGMTYGAWLMFTSDDVRRDPQHIADFLLVHILISCLGDSCFEARNRLVNLADRRNLDLHLLVALALRRLRARHRLYVSIGRERLPCRLPIQLLDLRPA